MENVQLTAIDKNEIYSEKVYRQLKQLIVANHIKPGEILNERELADSLSVSRTPIRDALRTLEQEGWISKKGKFKVVSLLTWKSVQSLMEIRRPLELMSYDLAVQKITDEDVEELERIYRNMEKIAEKKKRPIMRRWQRISSFTYRSPESQEMTMCSILCQSWVTS